MDISKTFQDKVLSLVKKIPKGKITTYKQIGKALRKKAYRAVGNALNKNPYAPQTPCHRVVCSDRTLGGYSKGVNKKIQLLKKEGIEIKKNKIIDFEKKLFRFTSQLFSSLFS